MLAHLLPNMLCAAIMAASSSAVKGPFLTSGFSWFSHLPQDRHTGASRGHMQDTDTAQHRVCMASEDASSGPLVVMAVLSYWHPLTSPTPQHTRTQALTLRSCLPYPLLIFPRIPTIPTSIITAKQPCWMACNALA